MRLPAKSVCGDRGRVHGGVASSETGRRPPYLRPERACATGSFTACTDYAEAADSRSLIGMLAALPASGSVDPVGQVPHWLFAFDVAGMAASRTVAVLAARKPGHRLLALQTVTARRIQLRFGGHSRDRRLTKWVGKCL